VGGRAGYAERDASEERFNFGQRTTHNERPLGQEVSRQAV